jgi:rhodanese-related sulfurtransferase
MHTNQNPRQNPRQDPHQNPHRVDGVDVQALRAALDAGAARVIDVREAFEYAHAHIAGAELVPMHVVPLRLDELRGEVPLYLICASGNRSWQVASFLAQHDIKAYNVDGGMIAWQTLGHPVTTGSQP